jgi:hypothetical protein
MEDWPLDQTPYQKELTGEWRMCEYGGRKMKRVGSYII